MDFSKTIAKKLLQQMSKDQIMAFIKEHKNGAKFNMSGYDDDREVGSCTVNNQNIVNMFAPLGIYDYTKFLFLDFHKGSGIIYLSYWGEFETLEVDVTGYGTSQIIYEIFVLTVFSGKGERRRG